MPTLEEYLHQFGRTMLDAQHDVSWGEAIGSSGNVFVFVSLSSEKSAAAARILGAAGLLCETTLRTPEENDTPLVTESRVVQQLVEGLRALGSP